jgi:hypothetical protein
MTPKTQVAIENVFAILGLKDITVVEKDAKTYTNIINKLIDQGDNPTPHLVAENWPDETMKTVEKASIFSKGELEGGVADIDKEELQEKLEEISEDIADALGLDPSMIKPVIYEQPSKPEIDKSMIRQINLLQTTVDQLRQSAVDVGRGVNSEKELIVQSHFNVLIGALEDVLCDISFEADKNISEEYNILKYKEAWMPAIEKWEQENLPQDDQ